METTTTHENDEITYWEKVAKSRWGSYTSEIEKDAILRSHYLTTRPTTALEIGCEGGRWSKLLSDFGWRLICTDVNQQTLNICKKRIPTAKCILVSPDDSKIPCNTESRGLVLCIEVSPAITADWFIDEVFRVLQKGGLVVGTFWNQLSYRGLLQHFIASSRGSYDWYSLSYSAWKRRFRTRGFTFIHEEGFYWFPFQRASNSPLVPVTTRIERFLGLRKLVCLSPWVVFVAQKDG